MHLWDSETLRPFLPNEAFFVDAKICQEVTVQKRQNKLKNVVLKSVQRAAHHSCLGFYNSSLAASVLNCFKMLWRTLNSSLLVSLMAPPKTEHEHCETVNNEEGDYCLKWQLLFNLVQFRMFVHINPMPRNLQYWQPVSYCTQSS